MPKFRVFGSGGAGMGAGWIGKVYYKTANEITETDDPEQIQALMNSKMAIEVASDDQIPQPDDTLENKSMEELRVICSELNIPPRRSKEDTLKAIYDHIQGQ